MWQQLGATHWMYLMYSFWLSQMGGIQFFFRMGLWILFGSFFLSCRATIGVFFFWTPHSLSAGWWEVLSYFHILDLQRKFKSMVNLSNNTTTIVVSIPAFIDCWKTSDPIHRHFKLIASHNLPVLPSQKSRQKIHLFEAHFAWETVACPYHSPNTVATLGVRTR